MEKETLQSAVNISRPKQWDSAFDATMLVEDVDRLLRVEPFRSMDISKFPKSIPLRDILLYETRIRQFKKGEVIYRQGDFAVSAFLVLAGSVRSVFDLPEKTWRIKKSKVSKVYNSIKRAIFTPVLPEVRDIGQYGAKQDAAYVAKISNKHDKIDLTDLESFTKTYRSEVHPSATLLGEVALMSRSPHAMTVIASEQTELLEIKWQGFRELMKYDDYFKSLINDLYQQRSLTSYLRLNPVFEKVSDDNVKEIIKNTTFEAYGKFDWHIDFNKQKESSSQDKIQQEHEIIREGDYADDVLLIRSGFARITQKYGTGLKTVGYLKAGEIFGMDLLDANTTSYPYSLRSIGHTDVLRIPVATIKKYIETKPNVEQSHKELDDPAKQDLLGFFIDGRYMNGTQTMLINLDRCTGCDDCVTACARNHDNNPRFIRHGNVHNNFMVANACMHCHDPVCLIGCPTGAIHRNSDLGQIIINDQTCIGCMTCANSCPYNNIRMVNLRNESGEIILDEQYTPILKATKCDLCLDQAVSPACEYACPHNALKRIDIHNIKKLKAWLD